MTIEERLKDLILERYKSIREFTTRIDIPYSTVDSVLKRGINNSNIITIIRICKALGISADKLAEGEIVYVSDKVIIPRHDLIEVTDILEDTKAQLIHNNNLTINGKPVDIETVDMLVNGLEVTLSLAKKHNKTINKTVTKTDVF